MDQETAARALARLLQQLLTSDDLDEVSSSQREREGEEEGETKALQLFNRLSQYDEPLPASPETTQDSPPGLPAGYVFQRVWAPGGPTEDDLADRSDGVLLSGSSSLAGTRRASPTAAAISHEVGQGKIHHSEAQREAQPQAQVQRYSPERHAYGRAGVEASVALGKAGEKHPAIAVNESDDSVADDSEDEGEGTGSERGGLSPYEQRLQMGLKPFMASRLPSMSLADYLQRITQYADPGLEAMIRLPVYLARIYAVRFRGEGGFGIISRCSP